MLSKELKRIAIIGCGGSGKSTLALELKSFLSLPLYHLDQYYWKPNWTRPDFKEFQIKHNQLCDQDRWIIEGTTLRTTQYRFERADCIIFLDMPRWLCFWRVFKRLIKFRGKQRPDSAEGCPDKITWEFIKWLWNFKSQKRPYILESLLDLQDTKTVYIIRSYKDKKNLIEQIKTNVSND